MIVIIVMIIIILLFDAGENIQACKDVFPSGRASRSGLASLKRNAIILRQTCAITGQCLILHLAPYVAQIPMAAVVEGQKYIHLLKAVAGIQFPPQVVVLATSEPSFVFFAHL